MPPKGNEARAAALAEMAALLHRMRTDPRLARRSSTRAERSRSTTRSAPTCARCGATGARQRAARRAGASARRWPTSRCEHAWRTQRPANDWPGFLDNFREVLATRARGGRAAADATGLSTLRRADGPLRARHDERRRSIACSATLRSWLPGLIARRSSRQQARETGDRAARARSRSRRSARCASGDALLGFDFDAGRLDVSTHPFSRRRARGRAHDDALPRRRVPRQPDGHDPRDRPRPLRAEPAARAGSASRSPRRARWRSTRASSLTFEMQLGSAAAASSALLAPLVAEHFGDAAGVRAATTCTAC